MSSSNPLIISRAYAEALGGMDVVLFDTWQAMDLAQQRAQAPLGLALTEQDAATLTDAQRQRLESLHVPLLVAADRQAILGHVWRWVEERHVKALGLIGDLRAAAAATRAEHLRLQTSFADVENWLHTMLAPRFVRLRDFPQGEASVTVLPGQILVQPLPVASAALVAIDVIVMGGDAGALDAKLARSDGSSIAAFSRVGTMPSGVQRFSLDRAVGGHPEDCQLVVQNNGDDAIELALALPYPDRKFDATLNDQAQPNPLAVTLWAGLADVRLPAVAAQMPASPEQYVMPSDLPSPDILAGQARLNAANNTFELRANEHGTVLIALRGLSAKGSASVEAFFQYMGDGGAVVTLAAVPAGHIRMANEAYRLAPGRYYAATHYTRSLATIESPDFDLLLRVENAHPGAALWLWAVRFLA